MADQTFAKMTAFRMKGNKFFGAWLIVAGAVLLTLPFNQVHAQTTDSLSVTVNRPPSGSEILGFRQSFPYPSLSIVSVHDPNGQPITGLASKSRWLEAHEIAENGQPISQIWRSLREYYDNNPALPEDPDLFHQRPAPKFLEVCEDCGPNVPISVTLLMDMSSSLRAENLQLAKGGLINFVNKMHGEDRAGVIQFADTTSILPTLPMTSDKSAIIDFINSATTRDWTPLYRALQQGIAQVKFETNARRCIVIYTDGRNALPSPELNPFTPDSVIVNALEHQIPVFTIALGKNTNEASLKLIAEQTGGRFFKTVDGSEFEEIYDEISRTIRNYYAILYTSPDLCTPDSVRILDVSVTSSGISGRGFARYTYSGDTQSYDLAVELSSTTENEVLCIGDEISYSLTLKNIGPNTAFNVGFQHRLSDLVTSNGNYNLTPTDLTQNTALWKFDSLGVLEEKTISFTVRVNAGVPDTTLAITSLATVVSSCDANPENDVAENLLIYDPSQCLPDISVALSSLTDSTAAEGGKTLSFARARQTYEYSINVMNQSRFYARDVTVHSMLPDSVQAVGLNGRDLEWSLGTANPFSDTTFSFSVRLAERMPEGVNLLVNQVRAQASNEDPTRLGNNAAVDTVYNYVEPRVSDLAVRSTARTDSLVISSGDTVRFASQGETFTYLITVSNDAKYAAENVTLVDIVPDSVRVEGFAAGDSLRWDLGLLPAFGDTTLTFEATLAARMPEGFNLQLNRAYVRADNEDPTKLNNNASIDSVFNYVEPRLSDIAVLTRVRTDSFTVQGADTTWFVKAGETYTYEFTIHNNAKYPAENVTLTGLFPDHITLDKPISGKRIEWPLGRLSPFDSRKLVCRASVATELGPNVLQLMNSIEGSADNENPAKLEDNFDSETVFTIPPTEGCGLFYLDVNVYEPQGGQALGINFELNSSRVVRFDLYDVSGYHVTKMLEASFATGPNRFEWNGKTESNQDVGSGVYVITFRSGNLVCWKKVILAR